MIKRMSKMAGLTAVLALTILFTDCNSIKAQEADESMGITFDAAYATQYIWRGRDLFDDQPAFQPSVDFDLSKVGLEGFGFNVWGSFPLGEGGGHINAWDELDFTFSYGTTLMPEEAYALDVSTNYIYFYFPDNTDGDSQEIGASISLPNLFKVGEVAIVPGYYVGWLWGTHSGIDWGNDGTTPGWFHSLSLSADVPVTEDIALSLYGDINYDDGQFGAESDWSYATLGVSSEIPVTDAISVKPFLNYVIIMEESVCTYGDDKELFGGLSVSFSF